MNRWILICNNKYFNIKKAFETENTITWPQKKEVSEGDTIYFYVTNPYRAILYKCRVVAIGLYQMDESVKEYVIHALFYKNKQLYMRLKLLEVYAEDFLTDEKLKEFGIHNLQSAMKMPKKLLEYINNQNKIKHNILFQMRYKKSILIMTAGVVTVIIVGILLSKKVQHFSLDLGQETTQKELVQNAGGESKIEAGSEMIDEGDVTDVAFIVGEYRYRSLESLIWESSDDNIATVNENGIVTGISAGKVTITGTYNGQERSVDITVKEKKDIDSTEKKLQDSDMVDEIKVENLEISCRTTTLLEGDSVDVNVKSDSFYVDGKSKNIEWEIDNPVVASISNEGILTAKSEGTCELVAKYGEKKAVQTITVVKLYNNGATVSADYEKISISSYGEDTVLLTFGGNMPKHFEAIAYCSSGVCLDLEWGEMNENIVPLTIRDVFSEKKEGYVSVLVYEKDNPNHVIATTKIIVRIN